MEWTLYDSTFELSFEMCTWQDVIANTASLSLGSCTRTPMSVTVDPISFQAASMENATSVLLTVSVTNNDL